MKKILLTGINGQVGQELKHTLNPLGEVIGVNRQTLDLTKPEKIRQFIQEIKPNIIVNAAAYTAVDKAETESEIAFAVNEMAPTIMAEEATKLKAFLLHISTDYVFDGNKNTPYTEEDPTNPVSVYGNSKLAGEIGIKTHGDRYAILRTAWVYGTYGTGNFVKTMLRLGQQRETIGVVSDQVGTPTWAKDIADAIAQMLKQPNFQKTADIYHFTNSGVASWYDFALTIFEEAQKIGFSLKIDQVNPITTAEYPTPAKRPNYSVLSNQKIVNLLGYNSPYWRYSLRKMLTQLYQKLP
ncbi:MAG TPA: dTDP-4-dehydrorhamnose reductase [Cyanothece sp. UBA12306]|nr:dTDP-4-dehydrorhamnose reductase [Cyanothece sp. UBA12306]